MSDQALFWKFAFGALVLVFCAASWYGRSAEQAKADAPARIAAPAAAPAPAPLPAASVNPPLADPAPPDMPEAEAEPVRIRIAFDEAPRVHRPAAAKPHRAPRVAAAKHHRHRAHRQKTRFARQSNPISMFPWDCQTCLPRAEGA